MFERSRKRLWKAVGIVFAYSASATLVSSARTHFGLAFSEVLLGLAFFPSWICTFAATVTFKCPRCGGVLIRCLQSSAAHACFRMMGGRS